MLSQPFPIAWCSSFGYSLPAAFLCREPLADRWLRIHSLPESKRYAETEFERNELLRRQNAVATYVLGEDTQCNLLITRFDESPEWSQSEELPLNGRVPKHVWSAEYEGDQLQFFALPLVWKNNAFDELILAVADDRTGPVLVADIQRRRIYAPYDGGADLFFSTPNEADVARAKFEGWPSTSASGL